MINLTSFLSCQKIKGCQWAFTFSGAWQSMVMKEIPLHRGIPYVFYYMKMYTLGLRSGVMGRHQATWYNNNMALNPDLYSNSICFRFFFKARSAKCSWQKAKVVVRPCILRLYDTPAALCLINTFLVLGISSVDVQKIRVSDSPVSYEFAGLQMICSAPPPAQCSARLLGKEARNCEK
jgi:hypothetical protein